MRFKIFLIEALKNYGIKEVELDGDDNEPTITFAGEKDGEFFKVELTNQDFIKEGL